MTPDTPSKPWTREKQREVRELLAQALSLLERIDESDAAEAELRLALAALDEELEA